MHMLMVEVRSGAGWITVSLMIQTGSIYQKRKTSDNDKVIGDK